MVFFFAGTTAAEVGTAWLYCKIVFLAGTTAAKAGKACFFFWRGPRRRRWEWHVFLLAGTTAAEAVTASNVFDGDHGGGGGDGMYFLLAGSTAVEVGTVYIFFRRGARWRRRGRHVYYFDKAGGFVFGSGTAEVKWHRRRDLRAGRLLLRLFVSDHNDDNQFSSRLALRR